MKLIYCIHSVYNPGGMERVLLNKVSWLCDNTDWTIKIVTTDQHSRPAFYPFPKSVEFIDLNINYSEDNDLSALGKITGYLKRRRKHRKKLEKLLLKEKADVVVTLFPCESSFIPNIKDGSKKILELHFNKLFRIQYGRKGLIGLIDRIRMRSDERLARKFDKFVVLTEEDQKKWGALGNIVVIPNGVKDLKIIRKSSLEEKRVIAVGRLDYQKGFDKLIDAWHLLMQNNPSLQDWRLDIFGQGEWRDLLNDKIRNLELSNSVKINKPSNDIFSEYGKSSLLVMSSNYEGFGMVLVEAMACGVPCVSFACPCGPQDIIDDGANGFLVAPGDIEGLANAMVKLMSDHSLRAEMGVEARKVTETFSEEAVMARWMKLFNEITAKK